MMRRKHVIDRAAAVAALAIFATASATAARSQALAITSETSTAAVIFRQAIPDRGATEQTDVTAEMPARLRRQIVDYISAEPPGTIIVDTPNTYLYFVLGGGRAIRYGIGVGREGFTWSGVKTVERKTEWPDWFPPAEMVARQPYLPRFMAGGPGNPLGARAMYIAGTVYRIHGTNAPETIGKQVSSGCIRLANEDVIDLYNRVSIGTRVVVLPMTERHMTEQHMHMGGQHVTQRPMTQKPAIDHQAVPMLQPQTVSVAPRAASRFNGSGVY